MVNANDHESYVAATIIVLLSAPDELRVAALMQDRPKDQLVSQALDLLEKIDIEIAMNGFYVVPEMVDATWLAKQLQVEFGSEVDAGEHNGAKAIVLVSHYKI